MKLSVCGSTRLRNASLSHSIDGDALVLQQRERFLLDGKAVGAGIGGGLLRGIEEAVARSLGSMRLKVASLK